MAWARRLGVLVVAAVLLALPGTAGAALTVTNQNDSGPGSLRQTISEATPGDTVNVPAGFFTLTSVQIPIGKSMTIAGQGPGDTVIRASVPTRLFNITTGNSVTFSGMTLRDAHPTEASGVINGGAIQSKGSNVTLRSVIVTDSSVEVSGTATNNGGVGRGGGISVESASLSIFDSEITDNVVRAAGGSGSNGGVGFGGGIAVSGGALTIERSSVSGNQVLTPGGQGPSNASQNGGVADGGAIYLSGPPTPVSIVSSTLASNLVDVSGGPGANNGVGQGGGLYVSASAGAITMTQVTVVANSAAGTAGPTGGVHQGGGIYASTSGGSSLSLLSSTLANNRAAGNGSGDGSGGNLFASGTAKLTNSIVSGGQGETGKENCSKAFQSGGFNLESTDQCGFKGNGDQVNKDAQLGPLQNNGGPTPTVLPGPGSPAVDQGASFGLASDQRGVLRPIDFPTIPNSAAFGGNGADVGAVELQPSNAVSLGKLTRNRKKGTASIVVNVPVPTLGTLTLSGKGLKPLTVTADADGQMRFKIVATGGVKKALRKRGKRKVKISVTYTPFATEARTVTRTTKLIKKKRRAAKHGGQGK